MGQLILEVFSKHKEEGIIKRSQHEFTKLKSYLASPILFYDGISWVKEGRAIDVVFLDFSKAFDTVPHNILVGHLRNCR